jgi:hypothetical protein
MSDSRRRATRSADEWLTNCTLAADQSAASQREPTLFTPAHGTTLSMRLPTVDWAISGAVVITLVAMLDLALVP